MRKKVIFMVINMNVGGTEKALINMITEIHKEHYDITILMLEEFGGFLNSIPNGVHVEYLKEYKNLKNMLNNPPQRMASGLFKKGKLGKAFNIIFFHMMSKIMKERSLYYKYILYKCSVMKSEYDIAIAYAGPMDFISYFVANNIKAKKKIQWIHFDVSKIGYNQTFAAKIYKKFDKIFVVSKEGKNKLDKILPKYKHKTEIFYNILSKKQILKMADEGVGFQDRFRGIRILTVGRLSIEKGQDLTIRVLARLRNEGFNVRWYCIGDGADRIEYEKMIKEYKVESDFLLLGSKPNPYPYMKQCDIYVQPSRHEGYCITLSEARCFDNPIISTNFTGSIEQIIHNQTGLIVDFDENQLYKAVNQLLNDEELRNQLRRNLQKEFVDTTNEIEKLYKIAESI